MEPQSSTHTIKFDDAVEMIILACKDMNVPIDYNCAYMYSILPAKNEFTIDEVESIIDEIANDYEPATAE